MRGIIIVVLCVLAKAQILCAGWNEEFDAQSRSLWQALPELQRGEYFGYYSYFEQARKELLADSSVTRQFHDVAAEDKLQIFDEERSLVIKKRLHHKIYELFAWEVSLLLGAPEFIVPSFPVEIKKQKTIFQVAELFVIGEGGLQQIPHVSFVKKVSLIDYWKAHWLAYIMGMGDLVGQNIGINAKGVIRFFDVESSFRYQNCPVKTEKSFKPGFIMESFEWPQYRASLKKKQVLELRAFVESLYGIEDKLRIYFEHRPFSISWEGIGYRLEKIRSFLVQEDLCFRDFYGFLYPHMSEGLDELNGIVSSILDKKVDHGSAIIFASRRYEHYKKCSDKEKKMLQKWISTYVDE